MRLSGWHHRVVDRDGVFAVHEVHYDEAGKPVAVTENPTAPIGESLEELQAVCEQYLDALKSPPLHYSDFDTEAAGETA